MCGFKKKKKKARCLQAEGPMFVSPNIFNIIYVIYNILLYNSI